jgi:hypothetical protein
MTKPKRRVVYSESQGRNVEVESLDDNVTKIRKVRRARPETFAMVKLQWAAKAAAATNTKKAMVWTWLVYRAWRTRKKTSVVSNEALATFGVSRYVKYSTLRQLEKAKLITVRRQGFKAPIVTIRVKL